LVWFDFSSMPQSTPQVPVQVQVPVVLVHPLVELLWFDFSSMPQEPRTPEEEDEFKGMLSNINVIFLGAQVLILLDMTYTSRFWTQAEAWMSMQDRSHRS